MSNLKVYSDTHACFAHVLLRSDTDLERLTKANNNDILVYRKKILRYKYEIPETKSKFPLSGFLAIMDEFTSWAICNEDKKIRFGSVSTLLEANIGPAFFNETKSGDLVEFRARVEKIGNNLGFVSAEVLNVNTGRLVCFGRHTKFFLSASATSSQSAKKNEISSNLNYHSSSLFIPNLDDVLNIDNLVNGATTGKIYFEQYQKNTMGGLHGGYQGMIMEKIGFAHVKIYFNSKDPILESISVSFLSAATKDCFSFHISYIYVDNASMSMIIRLKNDDNNTISEGILLWKNSLLIRSKY